MFWTALILSVQQSVSITMDSMKALCKDVSGNTENDRVDLGDRRCRLHE